MITITNKELLTFDGANYQPFQVGDDLNKVYVHVELSNNTDYYVCGWWADTDISNEIQAVVDRANAQAAADTQAAQALQSMVNS